MNNRSENRLLLMLATVLAVLALFVVTTFTDDDPEQRISLAPAIVAN